MPTINKNAGWLWTFWGCQCSLHAMVLRIGATKNEGYFVVYVVFEDKWWLCDDARVKWECPPPNPLKASFLLYKCKPTALRVLPKSVTKRTKGCHQRVSPKGVTKGCHQRVSPKGVTKGCHQRVSPKSFTKGCH